MLNVFAIKKSKKTPPGQVLRQSYIIQKMKWTLTCRMADVVFNIVHVCLVFIKVHEAVLQNAKLDII